MLVSLLANLQEGGSDIAIGNIVGSNIANLALILGIAAVMAAIPVERHLLRREYPFLLVASTIFIALPGTAESNRVEGIVFVIGLIGFTVTAIRPSAFDAVEGEHALDVMSSIDESIGQPSRQMGVDALLIAVGLIGLIIGAPGSSTAPSSSPRTMGVSELVIGLTLVALGTSLPELATTVIAVLRNEGDIAVGNVVGSNLFNILFIGGVSSLVKPLSAPAPHALVRFPRDDGDHGSGLSAGQHRPHRLSRWQGALLLLLYAGYAYWLFLPPVGF